MKKIILAISLLFTTNCFASPFIVTDAIDKSMINSCTTIEGTITKSFVPESVDATTARCKIDLVGVTEGIHNLTLKLVNVWGESQPVPFTYTKKLPSAPSNIRLEP